MPMRRIEIDEDVYAALAERAKGFDTPNDVLRRLLLEGSAAAADRAPSGFDASTSPGALAALIDAGSVKPGDSLLHTKVRSGQTFIGTVESDGWVRTKLGRYKAPSRALGELVGTAING